MPSIRPLGAIGTSDLSGLAQLGLTLVGELPWRSVGQGGGVEPVMAGDGDGLPFLSSSAVTTAAGSLAARRLHGLSRTAEVIAALSHLALRGASEAYDARVHAGKDDPTAAAVAGRMRRLLGLDDPAVARPPSRLQDPFSLRALPQVHAPLQDALTTADRAWPRRSARPPRTRSWSTSPPCTTGSSTRSGSRPPSTRPAPRRTGCWGCRPPAPRPCSTPT